MLSILVDNLCRQLLQKIGSAGERFSYFELTHHDTDEVIGKIFLWRYEPVFIREKERIESGPKEFAFQADHVQKGIAQYLNELKKAWVFSRKEVESILHDALMVRINYIIKPLDTAEQLLFSGCEARNVGEIVQCMKDFEKYRYYPDALNKYASAKNMTHLTKGQFRLLITEINQSLFGKGQLENILKVCGLIMKEINDLRGQTEPTLSIDLYMEAFRDRSIRDFEVALNIEKELGNQEINLYGLRQVLSRFLILKEKKTVPDMTPGETEGMQAVMPPKTEAIFPKSVPETESEKSNKSGPVKKDEDSGELIDINEVLLSEKARTTGIHPEPPPAKEPSEEIDREVTGEFIREELVPKFSDDTKSVKILNLKEAEILEPLETLITPKDEKIFMKKIFGGNDTLYGEFIHRINSARRWKHSMTVIDEVLNRQKIDPYCREAIRLSDIVYQRYYPPAENPL